MSPSKTFHFVFFSINIKQPSSQRSPVTTPANLEDLVQEHGAGGRWSAHETALEDADDLARHISDKRLGMGMVKMMVS